MAFFYRFVAASMDMENFASPAPGKLTPYTAVFVFAIGVFVSNFLFNTLAMKHPVEGKPVSICGYFKGNMSTHLVGVLGGVIWCIGQSFSMIASEKAGAAISYGLGQGATLVSALWGILIWKEFKGAPAISNRLNVGMFILFVIGLGFLIYAGVAAKTQCFHDLPCPFAIFRISVNHRDRNTPALFCRSIAPHL